MEHENYIELRLFVVARCIEDGKHLGNRDVKVIMESIEEIRRLKSEIARLNNDIIYGPTSWFDTIDDHRRMLEGLCWARTVRREDIGPLSEVFEENGVFWEVRSRAWEAGRGDIIPDRYDVSVFRKHQKLARELIKKVVDGRRGKREDG